MRPQKERNGKSYILWKIEKGGTGPVKHAKQLKKHLIGALLMLSQ